MNDFLIKVVEQEFDSKIKIINYKQCWQNESMSEYIIEFVYLGANLYKNVLITENNKSKDCVVDTIKSEIQSFDSILKDDNELKQVAYIYRNILQRYPEQLNNRYGDRIKEHREITTFVKNIKRDNNIDFPQLYKKALNNFGDCLNKSNKQRAENE